VLVPIDAFYEWENPEYLEEQGRPMGRKAPKQPWAYLPSAGAHLTLGGITTEYGGERTLSLITTQANATVGRIHDRMPVMLRDVGAARGTHSSSWRRSTQQEGPVPLNSAHD
jgi:putative SOS response-associated peptidase YedK